METITTVKTIKDVFAYWTRYEKTLTKGDVLYVRDENDEYPELSYEWDGLHFHGCDDNSTLAHYQNLAAKWVLD